MKKDMIFKELIQLDWEVENQDDFFNKIAQKLKKLGYVKETYEEALKRREENYPTALPIAPYPVAIPHADPEHIIKPFIASTRLKNPIEWREMANNDVIHHVQIIFVLGFVQSEEHIELLQVLIENLQNVELMKHFMSVTSEEEYYELICEMKGMDS